MSQLRRILQKGYRPFLSKKKRIEPVFERENTFIGKNEINA